MKQPENILQEQALCPWPISKANQIQPIKWTDKTLAEFFQQFIEVLENIRLGIQILQSAAQQPKQILDSKDDFSYTKVGSISYSKQLLLGRGCRSTKVFRGKYNGKDCAVKRMDYEDFDSHKIDNEINLMKSLSVASTFVQYLHHQTTEDFCFIAMELCSMTLDELVKQKSVPFSPVDILKQATTGLQYLHENNIIHMDIKPENILIKVGKSNLHVAKITDFGISKRLIGEKLTLDKAVGGFGTPGWTAPEVLRFVDAEHESMKCIEVPYALDIFSLGCVFYFTLSEGKHPFGNVEYCESSILKGNLHMNPNDMLLSGMECYRGTSLIETMIDQMPSRRPTCDKILASDLFQKFTKLIILLPHILRLLSKPTTTYYIIQTGSKACLIPKLARKNIPTFQNAIRQRQKRRVRNRRSNKNIKLKHVEGVKL